MKRKLFIFTGLLLVLFLFVSACTPAATEPAAQEKPITEEPAAATEVIEEPTVEASRIGGTITYALAVEADSLDPHKTANGASSMIMSQIYSSLISIDAQGDIVPYLATSWEISEDGLTYTFYLREDVKFHNGDNLTAEDVAWTYQRQIDPETASPTAAILESVETVEALDDYTVQFVLKTPSYYLLNSLVSDGYEGILQKKTVEESGDNYGRSPVGTGPFIFKEWVTGDRITLERNPDFTWGPSFTEGSPPNIQTIVFRIIPESSTIIAGLEAGELDYSNGGLNHILPNDVNNLEATGQFDVIRIPNQGIAPYVCFNVTNELFSDVKVRQALNYATDKQALMDIVVPNSGAVIQNGPLSVSQEGYWSGIEEIGYAYDLEEASRLMQEAGYTYNTDGMLEKDGQPLSFELLTPNLDDYSKTAEVLQSQWKALGVDVQLVRQEFGVALSDAMSGNYGAMVMAIGYSNSEVLTLMFHSKNIGGINLSQLNDPELDALLDQMVTAVKMSEHLQAAQDIQQKVVEEAYLVTMFSQVTSNLVSKKVMNYSYDTYNGFRLWDAYLLP